MLDSFFMLVLFWIYVWALKLVTTTWKALLKKGEREKKKGEKRDKAVSVNVKMH